MIVRTAGIRDQVSWMAAIDHATFPTHSNLPYRIGGEKVHPPSNIDLYALARTHGFLKSSLPFLRQKINHWLHILLKGNQRGHRVSSGDGSTTSGVAVWVNVGKQTGVFGVHLNRRVEIGLVEIGAVSVDDVGRGGG